MEREICSGQRCQVMEMHEQTEGRRTGEEVQHARSWINSFIKNQSVYKCKVKDLLEIFSY